MSIRRAVITGGRGDLARELQAQLSSSGYIVHSPGREDLDVRYPERIRSYFGSLGGVDLLINNAGITRDEAFPRITSSDWDEVVRTNLSGCFFCSRAAASSMKEARGEGHIINIGSFASRRGVAGQAAYASAKAGVIGLTQSMARELGELNIRVNCVLPGFLHTRMTSNMAPAARQQALQEHALRRFNTPEDAARFILFLDSMRHVSGQIFQLDSRMARWT